ncbi:hypothetical protein BKP35_13690 [Anaerobacillus arseniciselenatis]|uniref:Uncharacterized protein n=1 Tax=Anaerobacillus arseniciselenatis TaxID=85682 RepID=A0A1S2LCP1_9BACI|nr:hypothetical protein [Anaerobacillus arseniciselenatis]OIJ10161.1 hypothetical protein BKP35_13690 [Anaerobacillus arseniciselenatis]
MGKKTCWAIIIATIVINVVMLQWTVEAFLGRDYEILLTYNVISLVSAGIALFAYLQWRKVEYKKQ